MATPPAQTSTAVPVQPPKTINQNITELVSVALDTVIVDNQNIFYKDEITRKIDELHSDVVKMVDSRDLVITHDMLNQYEIRMYGIIADMIREHGYQNNLSLNQYKYVVLMVEIVAIMSSLYTLYKNHQSLNQMSMLCEIGKEIENLKDDTIDSVIKAYNNLSLGGGGPIGGDSIIQSIETFTTWDDIVGVDKLEIIKNTVDNPLITNTRTFLLFGPPGTGKTTIAFAIASAFSKNMVYYFSAQNLLQPYVGSTEKMLNDFFNYTKKNPQINFTIVFDEMDYLTKNEGVSYLNSITLTIQTNLGAKENSLKNNVCFVGITNYLNKIPSEVIRRMTPILYIDAPSNEIFFTNLLHRIFTPINYDKKTTLFEKIKEELTGKVIDQLKDDERLAAYRYTLSTAETVTVNLKAQCWQLYKNTNLFLQTSVRNSATPGAPVRILGDIKRIGTRDLVSLKNIPPVENRRTIIVPTTAMIIDAILASDKFTPAKLKEYEDQLEQTNDLLKQDTTNEPSGSK